MKKLPGFENYFVDKLGNVYSTKTGKLKKLKVLGSNYPKVTLYTEEKKRVEMRVHEAVMYTFVGNRPEGYEVCHTDGNKFNNRLENLRWGTKRENALDNTKNGCNPTLKLCNSDVVDIRWMLSLNVRQKEIALMFGVTQGYVSKLKLNKMREDY